MGVGKALDKKKKDYSELYILLENTPNIPGGTSVFTKREYRGRERGRRGIWGVRGGKGIGNIQVRF